HGNFGTSFECEEETASVAFKPATPSQAGPHLTTQAAIVQLLHSLLFIHSRTVATATFQPPSHANPGGILPPLRVHKTGRSPRPLALHRKPQLLANIRPKRPVGGATTLGDNNVASPLKTLRG